MEKWKREEIITRQLGKIGGVSAMVGSMAGSALGTAAGGRVNIAAAAFAALGGRSGAEFAARKLPVVEYTDALTLEYGLADTMGKALEVVTGLPEFIRLLEMEEEPEVPFISALVGSGVARMNPTVLCMAFIPEGEARTKIEFAAYAKEGLIKQKSSEKAVRRAMELIEQQA